MAPVFMSSASRCASSVIMNSLSPSTPKPRLTRPQQAVRPVPAARGGSARSDGPVRASIAHATFCGPVTYSTLSRRSDVVSKLPSVPVWNVHCGTQAIDVGGRDLRQRAVALVGVVAAEGQPARAVGWQAVENLLRRDERGRAAACWATSADSAGSSSEQRRTRQDEQS